ncbi:ribosomal large subunit pseudouridylate synthase D [Spiroplasma sp. TIUS-1]|uniref:RluA family pseudouridine synthase n=1 Tax=Spiroplasma sp. TIUS-1 TaxID=216963 RepID=UPI00139757B6|nr:ribosomal large subunit pseudouridylate synthase D [Spiroplasma sp. TIUS-1]
MQVVKHIYEGKPVRLDKFLVEFLKEEFDFSRSLIQKMIDNDQVKVNGELKTANFKISEGSIVEISIEPPRDSELLPKDIKFEIVYQDKDIIVINKPNNLVVHPAPGNYEDTLVNGMLFHIKDLSSIGGEKRPGIIHRLDKQTTGLMVVAKTDAAHIKLSKDFKERKVFKEYIALVHKEIEIPQGRIEAPIGRSLGDRKKMTVTAKNSKPAITLFEVLKPLHKMTLIKCQILTGRTHQIRVHMEYIGHPVVGDPVYGYAKDKDAEFGQYLHSYKLKFDHPITNKEIEFECELPKEFIKKIEENS